MGQQEQRLAQRLIWHKPDTQFYLKFDMPMGARLLQGRRLHTGVLFGALFCNKTAPVEDFQNLKIGAVMGLMGFLIAGYND